MGTIAAADDAGRGSGGVGDDAKAEKPLEKSDEVNGAAVSSDEAKSGLCCVGSSMGERVSFTVPVFQPPLQGSFGAGEESIAAADDADVKEEGSKEFLIWFGTEQFGSLVAGPKVKWEREVVAGPISVSH